MVNVGIKHLLIDYVLSSSNNGVVEVSCRTKQCLRTYADSVAPDQNVHPGGLT